MQQLRSMLHDDDSAVSPVIGVILMVAITVILAAVIASFVLGLGDADDPAPNPTVSTDFSSDEIEVDVTGGDDFEAAVSEVQFDLTVENSSDGDGAGTVSGSFGLDGDGSNAVDDSEVIDDSDEDIAGIFDGNTDVDVSVSDDEVTAGDSFTISFDLEDAFDEDEGDEFDASAISEYSVEIVWDPADQDSEVIFSDSS